MLKSAIVVTAIGSILSIVNIANAAGKSNHPIAKPNSLHHFTSNLIAKGKKAQIDRQYPTVSRELPGISKAISEYYKKRNESFAPSGKLDSGSIGFWVVTSLKLVDLSDTKSEVIVELDHLGYGYKVIKTNPRQWVYNRHTVNGIEKYGTTITNSKTTITLEKNDKKWKVVKDLRYPYS